MLGSRKGHVAPTAFRSQLGGKLPLYSSCLTLLTSWRGKVVRVQIRARGKNTCCQWSCENDASRENEKVDSRGAPYLNRAKIQDFGLYFSEKKFCIGTSTRTLYFMARWPSLRGSSIEIDTKRLILPNLWHLTEHFPRHFFSSLPTKKMTSGLSLCIACCVAQYTEYHILKNKTPQKVQGTEFIYQDQAQNTSKTVSNWVKFRF